MSFSAGFCIMGIDPGKSGALAFYFPTHPERVSVFDAPCVNNHLDAAGMADLVRQFKPDACVIEQVGAMPGQGVTSMFSFGRAFGTAIGVVQALQVPLHFVTPQRWKKHFHLSADKDAARARALQFWPVNAAQFCQKKDHGRAEAALIARFFAEVAA